MFTSHFYGEVLPVAARTSVSGVPDITWDEPGLSLRYSVQIENSKIHITVVSNRFEREDIEPLYVRALDLARAAVDLVSFSTGFGLSVVLSTFTDPYGESGPIIPKDDSLASLCTAFALNNGFDQMLRLVMGDPAIFMILRDLIEAITLPHASSTVCARAIEGMRHLIAPDAKTVKQEWKQMGKALRIDESYVQVITDISTKPSHAKRDRLPAHVTSEVAKRAWIVMNRFLEYKKRGDAPLPLEEFPVLKE